jgi:hypothetical protein
MKVWVSRSEAKEIRRWAMGEKNGTLADRFLRAERENGQQTPFLWRRRASRPLLVRCVYCEQWGAYKKHRHLKRDGWVRIGWGWLHAECAEGWKEQGEDLMRERGEAARRGERLEFLFREPDQMGVYKGDLIRPAYWQEHTFFGLLDDMEASIQADFGMERLQKVIDEMAQENRRYLVAGGFTGYHYAYHLLLAWAGAVPDAYADGAEFDDVRVQSVVVDDLPRSLRDLLPVELRDLV